MTENVIAAAEDKKVFSLFLLQYRIADGCFSCLFLKTGSVETEPQM